MTVLKAIVLSVGIAIGAAAPALADDAVDAARADMLATLGPNAAELKVLPEAYLPQVWAMAKRHWVDQAGAIPPKYRALIGLAVSSQIPCAYCIYADTSDARLFGATDEEIKEAILAGGETRLWSAILNGNQADLAAFKAQVDAAAAAAREAMAPQ